jgi:hypothetical protein
MFAGGVGFMTRLSRLVLAVAFLTLAPGCIATTHMSPDAGPRRFNEVQWRSSFEEAQKDAVTEKKPLLTIVAAGARNGFC